MNSQLLSSCYSRLSLRYFFFSDRNQLRSTKQTGFQPVLPRPELLWRKLCPSNGSQQHQVFVWHRIRSTITMFVMPVNLVSSHNSSRDDTHVIFQSRDRGLSITSTTVVCIKMIWLDSKLVTSQLAWISFIPIRERASLNIIILTMAEVIDMSCRGWGVS